MLTEERFLKILGYLTAYYNTFKFDLVDDKGQPSFQFKVWYDVFKEFDEDMVVMAVQAYCRSNIYAPQSPTSILHYMKERLTKKMMSGEEAWETVHKVLTQGGYHYAREIKTAYEVKEPVLYATYERLRNRFDGLLTADVPYVRKDFIETYNALMKDHVHERIVGKTDGFLEIETKTSSKLIGKGEHE
jgi:hypothetical protein